MTTMDAARVTQLTGPAAIEVGPVPRPQVGPDQVLIDVHFAGVTYPEVLLSRGEYQVKPDPPFILGSEVSGIVARAPEGSPLSPGARVAAFPGFGGFAEQVAAPAWAVFPLPDSVSLEQGAALPMNLFTVDFALRRRGGLRAGETVLVHGAGGGVGTAAIQLARACDARVIAVVSSDAKADAARDAGADEVVTADDFRAAVDDLTGGRGVDIVVDPVGGDRFTDSLRSLAPEGRLLVIGFTGGEIPTVRVNRLLLNNVSVVGVGWGAFWMRRPEYLAEQWRDLEPLVADGRITLPIGQVAPLSEAAAAVSALAERRATGKVLLRVSG